MLRILASICILLLIALILQGTWAAFKIGELVAITLAA